MPSNYNVNMPNATPLNLKCYLPIHRNPLSNFSLSPFPLSYLQRSISPTPPFPNPTLTLTLTQTISFIHSKQIPSARPYKIKPVCLIITLLPTRYCNSGKKVKKLYSVLKLLTFLS